MSSFGFVYILSNACMPDLVKIGCSERSPHARAAELSGSSGVPIDFRVLCYAEFENFQNVERQMHQWCAHQRVSSRREFFHGCLSFAVRRLWWHPERLSFTDTTAISGHAQYKTELLYMVSDPKELIETFDDLWNPFGDLAIENDKQAYRVEEWERRNGNSAALLALPTTSEVAH
jgi:hypothetical protein